MSSTTGQRGALEAIRVPVQVKLALLWTATLFCYLYGDYFELYVPGKLAGMLDGRMGPLGAVTQGVLVGTTVLMIVPSLMVVLSVLLKPAVNRIVNVVAGLVYSAVMLLAIQGAWDFYRLIGIVEIALTGCIAWHAWRWPRMAVPSAGEATP